MSTSLSNPNYTNKLSETPTATSFDEFAQSRSSAAGTEAR